MGSSQIPTSTNERNWIELATTSPSGVLTVSFTSLNAYRYYRVDIFGVSASGSNVRIGLRFNNDTGSNYASNGGTTATNGPATSIGMIQGGQTNNVILAYIENTANLTTVQVPLATNDSINTNTPGIYGWWNGDAQINRIDVIATQSIASGSITVYGSN